MIKFLKKLQEKGGMEKAEEEYSEWLKNEIADEISVELPIIDKIYSVLKRVWWKVFTIEEFKNRLSDMELKEWPEFILKKLYDFSIIGNFYGNYGNGNRVVFKHRSPDEIDLREKFIVHRWLHKVLALKDSRYHTTNDSEDIDSWVAFKHSLK